MSVPARAIDRARRAPRWVLWLALVLVLAAGGFVVGVLMLERYVSSELRARTIATLEARLESDLEIERLQVYAREAVRIEGAGLVLRHRGRHDVPPLVSIREFSAMMTWRDLFADPRRVARLQIHGLELTMPPGDGDARDSESGGCGNRSERAPSPPQFEKSPFVVRHVESTDATLTLLPSKPGKLPRVFEITTVKLRDLALDRPARFEAHLVNPTPKGDIATSGSFGPWNAHEPAATAVEGEYQFADADLGTIRGIAGTLQSTGRYHGALRQILVEGQTRTPDFGLSTSRNRQMLETSFQACVDGTDGDTYLDAVNARLGNTPIRTSGKVEGQVGTKGRLVALKVEIDDGRIEDLLRLSVDDPEPVMVGNIDVRAAFTLPPGPGEVVERLALEGRFALSAARFTDGKVQGRLNELSRRARGDMETPKARAVRSKFEGRFVMKDAVLQLPTFGFAVPGADVELRGHYGLKSEQVNFRGRILVDAKVSQMTTGFKSLLLKVVDPLFSRDNAGAVFPISITGSRSKPDVKVDVKKALLRKD